VAKQHRAGAVFCGEMRNVVFAKVSQTVIRNMAKEVGRGAADTVGLVGDQGLPPQWDAAARHHNSQHPLRVHAAGVPPPAQP
jgi:hypothetical protein